jgi:hypothetical protein
MFLIICLSIRLSAISPSFSPSVCIIVPSFSSSVCLSCLYVCLSTFLFICLFVCLLACLFARLSVHSPDLTFYHLFPSFRLCLCLSLSILVFLPPLDFPLILLVDSVCPCAHALGATTFIRPTLSRIAAIA